jgi:hypothetical protein
LQGALGCSLELLAGKLQLALETLMKLRVSLQRSFTRSPELSDQLASAYVLLKLLRNSSPITVVCPFFVRLLDVLQHKPHNGPPSVPLRVPLEESTL